MSSYERPRHMVYEDLYLEPDEIDDDWCAMVNEAYRDCDLRIVLSPPYYRKQKSERVCFPARSRSVEYETVSLINENQNNHVIDGKMRGVRMFPDSQDPLRQVPHIILTDVLLLASYEMNGSLPLSDNLYQRFFVPLTSNTDSVTFYSPLNLGGERP